MHRYHETGYYWHRERQDSAWQVVKLHRLHSTAPLTVLFVGRASEGMGTGIPIETLRGELVGPIESPDRKVVVKLGPRTKP